MVDKDILLNTFYEANEFVSLANSKEFNSKSIVSTIPIAVNCLFACELYLKILLLYNGATVEFVKKNKHYLHKLYDSLPTDIQNKINAWLVCFYGKNIIEFLKDINNDFTNLRYMYIENEIKKIDIQMISTIMYKLQYEVSMLLVGYDIYKETEEANNK